VEAGQAVRHAGKGPVNQLVRTEVKALKLRARFQCRCWEGCEAVCRQIQAHQHRAVVPYLQRTPRVSMDKQANTYEDTKEEIGLDVLHLQTH
jgi:hypothetical protein